jgi:DNA-binding winged helix-turn-helix (wHTH) protein
MANREIYSFGGFRLDAVEHQLWRNDEAIVLSPKQFELLFYFVQNAGRLLKKDELLNAIWADTYVEETTLARNVSTLRSKLGEGAGADQFIETIPKIGYRFVSKVVADVLPTQELPAFRTPEPLFETQVRAGEATTRNKVLVAGSIRRRYARYAVVAVVIAAAAVCVLAARSFIARKEIKLHPNATGVNVRAAVTVKNIAVDAALRTVDTGIDVQPGDILRISAMGVHRLSSDEENTFVGVRGADTYDHAFPDADRGSLVAWVGDEDEKDEHFQVSENKRIEAKRGGRLHVAINDASDQYSDNKGGLDMAVALLREYQIIAEDNDLEGAWGRPLVQVNEQDTFDIRARGDVAYWQGGELYDLNGSAHETTGHVAPEINARSLIGKIGTGAAFKVGMDYQARLVASRGGLYLTLNDRLFGKPGSFKNNSGELTVDIDVLRTAGAFENPF